MHLELYCEKDYEMIAHWYLKRDLTPVSKDFLPKFGYVIPFIAAGFMYQTDSQVCFIENLITNPDAPIMKKSRGIDAIINGISKKASELGYSLLVGFTRYDSVSKRVSKLGFIKTKGQFKMVSKKVGPWVS